MEVSNVFNTLTLKQIFWKTKTFLKKLEYCFLAKITKIENASFLFKTTLLEANVKTNKMVSTKWTYHRIFRKRWSLILGCFFPVSILKKQVDNTDLVELEN